MPLYWLKNDWEDALAASTDAAVKHKSKMFRLISISSTPQISLPGKARSRAPFRDCPSTSCVFHCSNAHVRQGCGWEAVVRVLAPVSMNARSAEQILCAKCHS